ncbi:MobF family relaxase [Microbacterium candidum]|uniref:MobF family relaxase n=1 Tax=Microbacterium candidum TaxID=3041922 RepID=A0ABT7MVX5_9MICO|nr:MobF family relaxase [Microbacterium sp. ASV49]MDL9978606.1 MobF family relaxase [Microbacterium sp. ASV49]
MRGGLERWKRGVESQGVRQAMAYAFKGSCDSHLRTVTGVEALAAYSDADVAKVARFAVEAGVITTDGLNAEQLRRWVDGRDPLTDEIRGRELSSPTADLILDGTINAPKSYSIAALINPDLACEFEALQDRLRERIITTWQRELNARRGAGGRIRESLHKIEVVELQHRRSRALDPHIHRHLWLNVKVQGEDGKWSNVDSRVAMKLHTLINAEGELAARADSRWIRALAEHGYTLNEDGEIAELAGAVRPLSRRSNQIEANRARLLIGWRAEHPGQEPDHDILQQIDRLAWAQNRPNKPGLVDESEWEQLIRHELAALDPAIARDRRGVSAAGMRIEDLDRDLLAAKAIVDADARSTACGGRFSLFDVRAGATRAVAASGVVADRDDLQEVIDDVVGRAHAHAIDLLDGEDDRPAHIKGFMAASTAALKVGLAAAFDRLNHAGVSVDGPEVEKLGADLLADAATLDQGQVDAAAAIAGTHRLVSVTGPAGAGKTTMLRVVRVALARQGRRLVVVAPTKKAASVAGREIGATASSLHALLADHGWRWGRDEAGAEVWTRLAVGELDPVTGYAFSGPRRFELRSADRVVVDEAGMVDLHTANALAAIAEETGAGIAMVGDHLQAMPVGHAGAMACMTRRATAVVELTAVHRFRDPEYAALTLCMREPASKDHALAVAAELDERGQIHRVTDAGQARDVMVEAYFRWVNERKRIALVTSTNEEADAINEAIQQRRVELGQLLQARLAVGQDEQRLLEGDVVQTRLNDRNADVENRALWTIRRILPDALELASISDSGDLRQVSLDYAASHVHLAYASTVHGIQGETTDASIVGPGVDASGLYVGMTRGRAHNEAIAIAWTAAAAREQVADSMMRGTPEVSIEDSVRAARVELGRAARDAEVPPWNDRVRRPFGTVDDIERVVRSRGARVRELRDRLEVMQEWMRRNDVASAGAAAMGRAEEACAHGRDVARVSVVDATPTAHALGEKTETVGHAFRQMGAEYSRAVRTADAAIVERALRSAMSHTGRKIEDRARACVHTVAPRAETGPGPSNGI